MLSTIRRACVTSCAVLVVGVVSVLPVQAAEETIKIGLTVSLTTDFALAGIQEKAGVEKALEEINAAGGIPGKGGNRKIELVLADNAASPSTAVNAINRVLASEPVAVILNIRGTQVLPQMPLIARAGIPAVTITGTRKVTQQGNPWVFRFYPHDGYGKPAAVKFAVETLKKKQLAILHGAEEFGMSGRDNMLRAMREWYKMEPVAVESLQPFDKDFAAQLLNIKKKGADVILTQTFQAPSALIQKQARQLNIGLPFVLVSQAVVLSALNLMDPADIAGQYGETVLLDPAFNPDPKVQAWVKEMEGRFKFLPDYQAALDYDVMKTLAKVIELHGPTPQGIQKGLREIKYQGLFSTYQADREQNMNHQFVIVKIDDKKRQVVEVFVKCREDAPEWNAPDDCRFVKP